MKSAVTAFLFLFTSTSFATPEQEEAINLAEFSLASGIFSQFISKHEKEIRTSASLKWCKQNLLANALDKRVFTSTNIIAAEKSAFKAPESEKWVAVLANKKANGKVREYELNEDKKRRIRSIFHTLSIGYAMGIEDGLSIIKDERSEYCKIAIESAANSLSD